MNEIDAYCEWVIRHHEEREGHEEGEENKGYEEELMTPEQAHEFERRMQEDDGLRREVAEWREALDAARKWAAEEAPGVGRVKELPVPVGFGGAVRPMSPIGPMGPMGPMGVLENRKPSRPRSRRLVRLRILQVLGVAAVFVLGFALGHSSLKSGDRVAASKAVSPSSAQQALAPTPVPELPSAAPTSQPKALPGGIEVASTASTEQSSETGTPGRYARDENGRLTVETTLKASGGRALWVVDGSFQLAQNSTSQNKGVTP